MKKTQIDWIKILRDAVNNEQIEYVDTLRKCQKDFIGVPLSKVAADTGVDAWIANLKTDTLGHNFAMLDNLCSRYDAKEYIVFDTLAQQFQLRHEMFIKNSLVISLSTSDTKPITAFDVMKDKLDESIGFDGDNADISREKLFNLFKENKTDEVITIYKKALLDRINLLEKAVDHMTDESVCFKPVAGEHGVLTPIETYYGSPQAVYKAFIDKLDEGYLDVQCNMLEGIVAVGLCDDADLNILSKDDFFDVLDAEERNGYLSLNGIIYWMTEKAKFDSIYR